MCDEQTRTNNTTQLEYDTICSYVHCSILNVYVVHMYIVHFFKSILIIIINIKKLINLLIHP
jgi:hypothetical protein